MVASPVDDVISRAPGDLACLAGPVLGSPEDRRFDEAWWPPPEEETLRLPSGGAEGVGESVAAVTAPISDAMGVDVLPGVEASELTRICEGLGDVGDLRGGSGSSA